MTTYVVSNFKPNDNWNIYIKNNPHLLYSLFNGFPYLICDIYNIMTQYINSDYTHIIFTELDFKQRHTLYVWLYCINSKYTKCIINNKRSISIEINEEWDVYPIYAIYCNEFSIYTRILDYTTIFNIKCYKNTKKYKIKLELIDAINSIKNNINYNDYINILSILYEFKF